MRVLAVTNLYPRPGHETLAPFNRQQFAALARQHELAIIAPVPWTDELRDRCSGRAAPARHRSVDGIEVSHPRYYFTPRTFRASYGRFFLASIRHEFRRLCREMRPDVILGCWAHPDGWAAVELAREAGLPCVIKVVGSDVLVVGGQMRRARMVAGLRRAAAVVAVSRDLADRVIALQVPSDRVHVVYNGLDAGRFRPGSRDEARTRLGLPPGGPIVLFVGNLLMSKGVGVLADALATLARSGATPRCYFVGRGRDEGALRARLARLGLDGVATLVGPVPHGELPDWYLACDVVALPSYSEGIPNVLLEASACGRPYVATRVGGIPEVAGERTCRLVPPGDPQAVAGAIAEILAWGPIPPTPSGTWDESAAHLAEVLRTAARASNGRQATDDISDAQTS